MPVPSHASNSEIVLMDNPEDGYCDSLGWVQATVPEDRARDLLAEFCIDEDSEPGVRPAGSATHVWLRHVSGELGDEDERWDLCEPADDGAIEFLQFDATDTEPRSR